MNNLFFIENNVGNLCIHCFKNYTDIFFIYFFTIIILLDTPFTVIKYIYVARSRTENLYKKFKQNDKMTIYPFT